MSVDRRLSSLSLCAVRRGPPIIPIKLNNNWNLITRTNFSVSSTPDSGTGRITGASDLTTEFYFSPEKTNRFIWGLGPVLGIPTASDVSLGPASGLLDRQPPLSSRPSTGPTACLPIMSGHLLVTRIATRFLQRSCNQVYIIRGAMAGQWASMLSQHTIQWP